MGVSTVGGGFDIGDSPEPLVGSPDETGHVPLDILDIVELGRQGVVDIDDNDLPVGLSLIKEGHDSEDLDLLDLTRVSDGLSNLADVEGVVVSVRLGLGVHRVGVLPGLGERSVVPEVTLVGEAVPHEPELALLGVLEDGVEALGLGDFLRAYREGSVNWCLVGVEAAQRKADAPSWRWTNGGSRRPC